MLARLRMALAHRIAPVPIQVKPSGVTLYVDTNTAAWSQATEWPQNITFSADGWKN